MKKLSFKLLGMALFFWMALPQDSYAQKVSAERIINKTFPTNANSRLSIYNKYGKVHISTSNSKEIKLKIRVVGKSSSYENARRVADNVSVNINQGDHIVIRSDGSIWKSYVNSFKQKNISFNSSSQQKAKKNVDYEVNYEVSIPKTLPLILNHAFGELYLGDHRGKLSINMEHGPMKAERLQGGNQDKDITIRFGSANIEHLDRGNVNVYYSDFKLQEGGEIQFEGNGGDFEIVSVDKITGSASKSTFKIGTLGQLLSMTSKYNGQFSIGQVAPDFENISLKSSYNDIDLAFGSQTTFNCVVNMNHGEFNYNTGKSKLTKKNSDMNKAVFTGTYGFSSNPKGSVNIQSLYGNVLFK